MLYKEIVCPVCNGHGFICNHAECHVSAERCTNCQNGLVVVPMTNGDLIRSCSNEQLNKVYFNLDRFAIYSGGSSNRQLCQIYKDSDEFLLWLNKATDEIDLRTIFNFINANDFEHPLTKVVKAHEDQY